MPRKGPSTEASRLDAVEARALALATRLEQVERDLTAIRAELASRGVVGPVVDVRRRQPELTAEQRQAIRQQNARAARAAKSVGAGQGAVKSAATKRRLAAQAQGAPIKKDRS